MKTTTPDPVIAPDYYRKHTIEPVEVTEQYDLNSRLSQCVQYILRHKDKGDPVGDLKKAKNWLTREITAQESGTPQWEDEVEAVKDCLGSIKHTDPSFDFYDFYLSGPMTGLPEHNFPAFNTVAAELRTRGYKVFNPAETDGGDAAGSREYYMRIDIAAVAASKNILLLPGWETCVEQETIGHFRRGVLTELLCAVECGLGIYKYTPDHIALFVPVWEQEYKHIRAVLTPSPDGIRAGTCKVILEPEGLTKAPKETILQEAQRLVHGDRNASYGHPVDDMDRSGAIVTAILGDMLKPGCEVKAEQMCLIMQAVKISRETNRPKRDNRTDGCGYWECLQMVHEERERRARNGK